MVSLVICGTRLNECVDDATAECGKKNKNKKIKDIISQRTTLINSTMTDTMTLPVLANDLSRHDKLS